MNVTVRKALTLVDSIKSTIDSIKIKTVIELNIFQEPMTTLKKANDFLFSNDGRRQKLLLALYNLKGLIATADMQNGAALKLTTIDFINHRIEQLRDLENIDNILDLDDIRDRIQKIEQSSIKNINVSTAIINNEQMNQIIDEIKNLQKQKQKFLDDILELNLKTEIPLSDDVVRTLEIEKLI